MSNLAETYGEEFAREWHLVRPRFDLDYYLKLNPDVEESETDPLIHFLVQGWREECDPNPSFSVREYLDAHPEVARSGVNPFVHFLRNGTRPKPRANGVNSVRAVDTSPAALEKRVAAVPAFPADRIDSEERLSQEIARLAAGRRDGLHLSVSHDDYTTNIGGVQLCLHLEARAFERRNVDRMHLYPARPLLVTARDDEDPVTGVLINGASAGYYRASAIARCFSESPQLATAWRERTLAIHSLLGHNVDALVGILKALRLTAGFFWVHDFASICAGLHLLRNDREFCGGPAPESAACASCTYGERRRVQIADHERVFSELAITVVAPAPTTLRTWQQSTNLRAVRELVVPHCRLIPREGTAPTAERPNDGPLRVAFLGMPDAHKGWPGFYDLARRFARDGRYEFFHLGAKPQGGVLLRHRDVRANASLPDAMVRAVEELEIDVVVNWSMCAETFSFTAHEAIAGGAVLVVREGSGNLAVTASASGGVVLAIEQALSDAFRSGSLMRYARTRRRVDLFSIEYSDMSASFVGVAQ